MIKTNVYDTALIFEGGGMKCSYTAGILNVLLDKGIYFDYVSGISAGASNALNYFIRDGNRAKGSLVDIVKDENFGGISTLLDGKGYFNSDYIYTEVDPYPQSTIGWDHYTDNPGKLVIGAFDAHSGQMKYWTNKDADRLIEIKTIVRASCSLPLIMNPTEIDDRVYFDGGLGHDIAFDRALEEGYEKVFVVLSQKKDYRKDPPNKFVTRHLKRKLKDYPKVLEATLNHYETYNRDIDRLENLARQGKAYIVYAKDQSVKSTERNFDKLQANYEKGYAQGLEEYKEWKEFLNLE